VTDDDGATATVSRQVTVSTGAAAALADDVFGRTVTGGLGTASPTGGAWTSTNTVSGLSVAPGAARLTVAAAGTTGAYLAGVSATDVEILTSVGVEVLPVAGNGYSFYTISRRISSTAKYMAKVRFAGGSVRVSLVKNDGSATEVAIVPEVTALTATAGARVNVRIRTVGTNPTTLQARVWLEGSPEPAAWTVTGTDASASLQTSGTVGLQAYLSGSVTNGPIAAQVARFTATAP
jgi:hypothetical protein